MSTHDDFRLQIDALEKDPRSSRHDHARSIAIEHRAGNESLTTINNSGQFLSC